MDSPFDILWNETQDVKTKIIDRWSKQLNVMQITHFQQSNYILKFKRAAHLTQHVGVKRKSNTESISFGPIRLFNVYSIGL